MDTVQVQPKSYNNLFFNYLKGSIAQSLARVRAEKYTVPEVERVQAWHVLSYALEVEEMWAQTRELLLALAPRMELAGFRHDWIPYLEQGVERGRALGDETGVARLGLELGLLWMRMGEYEQAQQWLTEAEEVFAQCNDMSHRALALNRLSEMAQQQGQLDQANRLATAALDLVDEYVPEYAHSLFILGMIDFDMQRLDSARNNFEEAAHIWAKTNNDRFAAIGLQNLGRVYMAQKAYTKAIELFEEAVQDFHLTGDVAREAAVRMNQGICNFCQNNYAQSLAYYQLAETEFKRILDKMHLAMINNNYGLLHLMQQQWKEAEPFFRISISYWVELGNDTARLNSVDGLGQALIGLERYKEATRLYKNTLPDLSRVNNEQRRKQLSEKFATHLQQAREKRKPENALGPSFT